MAEVGDGYEAIFDLQHCYNTRSKVQISQENLPTMSTSNTGKATPPRENVFPKIEYNLIDDPKMAEDPNVAEVVRQLDKACRETGFFYVVSLHR